MHAIQNHPADRLRDSIDANRGRIVLGILAAVAAVAVAIGLFSGSGGNNPLTAPDSAQITIDSAGADRTPADEAAPASAPGQTGAGPDGAFPSSGTDIDTDTGSGTGSGGGPGAPTPADPSDGGSTTPSPTEPDPTPTPANQPPVISDIEVEASGLLVVVSYRVADPDGDEVTTDVMFGDPVGTGVDTRPEAPKQGELSGETGGGRGPLTVPTAPGGQVFEETAPGSNPADDEDRDHGPRPTSDGRIEARHTYGRATVGAGARVTVTIVAQDSAGAEDRQTTDVDVEALDRVTISDIRFRFPSAACFETTRARRLHGNLDLLGAIESKTALDEEFRADRSEVTIVPGRTVEATPGVGLTVSFQPAMELLQLTNHVATHTESARVDVAIGSGDCTGRLAYQVVVAPI